MKLAKLALLLLFITFCTEDNNLSIENNADEAVENQSNNQEDLVDWDSALGKSPEIFVSTWNSVVNSISNDEETILFFSINPDEVKWTSSDKDQLVYKWGDASKQDNIFILNLNIENEIVRNALKILNRKKLGFIVIINNHGLNTGIFTDGDLKRSLQKNKSIRCH